MSFGWILWACVSMLLITHFSSAAAVAGKPNILFVIMDDVGVDQLALFGYGGYGQFGPLGQSALPAPQTPTLNALAAGGVKFRNAWASPECSPSRASFFTGRYPMRHNVMAALLPTDLANSQLSPFETTTPSILRKVGYKSALFGKSHFTNSPTNPQDPSTDPYKGTAVTQLGWDYFEGWYDGGPNAIDTTAGGVADPGTVYSCGYVPNKATDPDHGADSGACYQPTGSCSELTATAKAPTPGLTCLAAGGVLNPNEKCDSSFHPDFNTQNGFYVSQRVINEGRKKVPFIKPVSNPSGRGYRTTLEANFAINWIKKQPKDQPWMATVSFASAHTPYQPAPESLVYTRATTIGHDCKDSGTETRALMTEMIEALDKELGRILIETGIAKQNPDGSINYDPAKANTMIVVVGDNGSYAVNVRLPFDAAHSKGTVYQTGVWVPLIVSGPMVTNPGRSEESMVNVVDLFSLFGEVAGVNVRNAVPSTHFLDAEPLYPYLTNPKQSTLRTNNFTQYGENQRSSSSVTGPCVIQSSPSSFTCTILFPKQSVCEINYAGTWYGKGKTFPGYPEGFQNCCQTNQYLMSQGQPTATPLPDQSSAIRDPDYKLIRQTITDYDPNNPSLGAACLTRTTDEFYLINQNPVSAKTPQGPTLDRPNGSSANNLLPLNQPVGQGAQYLSGASQEAYVQLDKELTHLHDSATPCPGDVNLDGVLNFKDSAEQAIWIAKTKRTSTWWDLNEDGYTNLKDKRELRSMWNTRCQLPR